MTKPEPKIVDNLGKRHREHNAKVNEAAAKKVRLDDVKDSPETSDLDKLFKIDLAAKYENQEFVVDILKSADSLYTSRALKKCPWLFTDKYSNIINPNYLQGNVFPFTSTKMKRKILTAISMHVRNDKRAAEFYTYCMQTKLTHIAFKFFRFTSEAFKLDQMENHNLAPFNEILKKDIGYLKKLIGKSFDLLEAFLEMLPEHTILNQFQYFYTVSNERYLDLIEKYWEIDGETFKPDSELCVGIMQKNKSRVLANPCFYLRFLDNEILSKYSTPEDVNIFAVAVLPEKAQNFWTQHYYYSYKYFLKHIPHEETYAFIKRIFQDRYPDDEFEMTPNFYHQNYYTFMTIEELEEWAWRHIKSEKQILGVGNDYKWYRFINFTDAFETVKKNIIVTKEAERRCDMLNVLVESARTNNELKILLDYYFKRHVNEIRNYKDIFLKKVISYHNVFEFDERCWTAFYTMLQSMEIFNTLDLEFQSEKETYKDIALIYHIVHKLQIPDPLVLFMTDVFKVTRINNYYKKLDEIKKVDLFEFLYTFYINKILECKYSTFTSVVEISTRRYFQQIVGLMSIFHKEEPKPLKRTGHINANKKTRRAYTELSDRGLIDMLKKDINLLSFNLPQIKERFDARPFKIRNFLKKVRVYFPNDMAKEFLSLFVANVARELNSKAIEAAVYGIFELADEKYKVDFMNAHVPEETKIDCNEVDAKELRIRRAICRFACCSRPPVPLANTRMYIKGDYVKNCLHVFNMFHANLSLPMCLKFVELVINAPVSVQKHGMRLAFRCFDNESLKKIIINQWKKTKNVSIREVIYKALFEKVKSDGERVLNEVLRELTLDLQQDDEDGIFTMLVSNELSEEFLGDYYEAAWLAVSKFKDIEPHIQRKTYVIRTIRNHIHLMREGFVKSVIDEHINTALFEKRLDLIYSNKNIKPLFEEKRKLAACYIIFFNSYVRTDEKYVDLTKSIVTKCVDLWDDQYSKTFLYREFFTKFISDIKHESYANKDVNFEDEIPIFKGVIDGLLSSLNLCEVYCQIWDMKLTILNRKILENKRLKLTEVNVTDVLNEACIDYGIGVGKIVEEFIGIHQYFNSLSNDIKDKVLTNALDLFKSLNQDYSRNKYLISVARGLVGFKLAETHILAILLLPTDCESVECKEMLEEIRLLPASEVQCALYLRFNISNKTNAEA